MHKQPFRRLAVVLSILLLSPAVTLATEVHPLFDLTGPVGGPFPSDRFTVADPSHITGLRVNLPKPDCQQRPTDCEDIDVINTLDGFNVQPRLSIPFNGAIDVHSITSDTIFLIKLVCPHDGDDGEGCDEGPTLHKVGVNQIVWDTFTNTLYVESDALLEQHTRYALIVTRGVRDGSGGPIAASQAFRSFRQTARNSYKYALLDAVHGARKAGVAEEQIAVASVFTTQSVTAILEKIRDQIKAATPSHADFNLTSTGSRTVFPFSEVVSISWMQQTGTTPTFRTVNFDLAQLRSIPGAVGQLAFGRFLSPEYRAAGEFIPPIGSRNGSPAVQGTSEIYFNLVLPSGTPPPGGWPVAIAGHGGDGSKENLTIDVVGRIAAALAEEGIATIGVNAVGHGFGPLGTLTVNRRDAASVTFSSGGRGIDQNGDRIIETREGIDARRPVALIGDRDGLRQTVADLLQLVRVIEAGVDVDADGVADLDAARIYYAGQSLAAKYGTYFLALEPDVRTAVLTGAGEHRTSNVLNVVGGRAAFGGVLTARTPSLINGPAVTSIDDVAVPLAPQFNENMPLRDSVPLTVRLADGTENIIRSPVINAVPGAIDIQDYLDRVEWVAQSGNPVAFAPYLRKAPLKGVVGKSVIVQFAKGDRFVPNPATTALLRAGDLGDRATYYRHDLASLDNPALPKPGHGFMVATALFGDIARGAQKQIAVFFATDGTVIIHPEPAHLFEVPIAGPLPEGLNFIR